MRYSYATESVKEMAKEGCSLDRIRDFLNTNGVRSPRRKAWGPSTVHSLLELNVLMQYAVYVDPRSTA